MKKSLLLIVLFAAIIFIRLRWNSAPFFSTQQYQCVYDKSLSDTYCASINASLVELMSNNVVAHNLINQLQQRFPVFKKIVISYRPSGVHVMMSTDEPVCCVNDMVVITAQKNTFPKNIFSDKAMRNIIHVIADKENMQDMSYHVSQLLQMIPYHMHQKYNIELVNEHCVRLTDKHQDNFTIVSAITQDMLPTLLTYCETIKQTMSARGEFDKGKKWVADTRFAHYIVAYKA